MKKDCADESCAVLNTLQLVGNKWVLVILSRLLEGTKRFGELQKEIDTISPKMLTQQLRKMKGWCKEKSTLKFHQRWNTR